MPNAAQRHLETATEPSRSSNVRDVSAHRLDASIVVFATQGSGSFDEDRIRSLTAALKPTVWAFDRRNKRRSALTLLRRLGRECPDLLVIEGTSIAGGVVALAGRLAFRVPYVVSSGDAVGPFVGLIAPSLAPAGHVYELVLYRFCAGFIGWTPYLAGRALTLGAPRVMTAANWAPAGTDDAADGTAARDTLGIPRDALVFGLVGSLTWSERASYCYGLELVRALRQTTRYDVRVLIVGDGTGLARLRAEAAADLGVRVHLTGQVPRDALGPYLAAMDVASLPQSVDGVGAFRYSTKLSEYLAAGLPVVTGELPFSYDLGAGWLWRLPGDAPWTQIYIDALAALMARLGPSDLQQRKAAVPRHLPIFDQQSQQDRVTEFVGDVLERAHGQRRPVCLGWKHRLRRTPTAVVKSSRP
jgi:glycosyltransferase involved in cell wall biosynthesis